MKLEEVILRGTRAAQPGAGTVPAGTLYYVTDEDLTERSTGAAWQSYGTSGGAGDLLADGTVPLTAAWDAGPWQIRAETFQSDIATGTAPLTVASTTLVTNLNADLLDGVEETTLARLAGRAGGQSLIGGTGSGDDLTLRSSSHATKGKVIFGLAGTTVYDEVNERLGIVNAAPAVPLEIGNVAATWAGAFASSLLGIGGGTNGDFYLEGSAQASFVLDDSGGAVDQKLVQIKTSASVFNIRGINDAASAVTFELLHCALDTGLTGMGTLSPAAKLHVDQPDASAAVPVLYLDQADVSEEMIEFNTTIGIGNAIEAVGAKSLTTTHFIKVTLPGALTRYIPCGTIA